MDFKLVSSYKPKGDQPKAIDKLFGSITSGNKHQTLLGVTGSGKTFTMANVIEKVQKPTLIISHNKTLAAQLYSEFKAFFPDNAVEYFVSYYDYYQPEAYVPQTDTYIEKDSSINDDIDRLRISTSSSLLTREDVIVIASVSCIYGAGSPDDFENMRLTLSVGMELNRDKLLGNLVEILYSRNEIDFKRGTFRVKGDTVDIYPSYLKDAIRVSFFGDLLEELSYIDPLTGKIISKLDKFVLYPGNQYATSQRSISRAILTIKEELADRVNWFEAKGQLIEAQRIKMRTEYDLELLQEIGFCSGIENYSRHFSGRKEGERPMCLLDFFKKDFLVFIDESHVTIPQIRAMFAGDRSRKEKLVKYGFRLPSALDNRPQKFEEFNKITNQLIYVSATPAKYELDLSEHIVNQIIRPTGLLDPKIEIRKINGQVENLIGEIKDIVKKSQRVLVTTLTKRMSEDITQFMEDLGIRVEYMHSDIDAVERVEIIQRLRKGEFDVLVGVNLLREGLDLPEVSLVAVLDADKEGFLRSTTSLTQTAGRASRHVNGRVIFYADCMTESIKKTIRISSDRRAKQIKFNLDNNIVPKSVSRNIDDSLKSNVNFPQISEINFKSKTDEVIEELNNDMLAAANNLDFEKAALIRDQIKDYRKQIKASK